VVAATLELPDRRRWIALAVLLGFAALAQGLILAQQLASDPLAASPINDADVYWQWAGDIANGKLVGATPFLSAPLYPYLLGLVRALGGGLATVYVLQAALHLATGALLFRVAERRFGFAAAVVGAGLYFALLEPAYFTARILSCSLQLFLVVWLWDRMVAAADDPRRGRLVALGIALGANVLANPTMLVAVPLVAGWLAASAGRRRAALVAVVGILAIVPATVHNALACGELIAVSAQGGVTFYHGNAPGADGVYHAIPGISENRIQQNIDARTMVAAETDGSWGATSNHFFRKGLAFWRSDPAGAVRLAARKLWYFATGRAYGDIYVPALERANGFASRLALAPLPTAWLTLPALVVLAWLLRDPRKHFPEALLVLLPLATVAIFWYSPRYRIPAVPLLAALSGYALAAARSRGLVVACGLAFVVAIGSGWLNRRTGFDAPVSYAGQYAHSVGGVLVEQGRLAEAEARFRDALAAGHAPSAAALADVFRREGRREDALAMLREAAQKQPASAYVHRSLAVALAEGGELDAAEQEFRATLAIDPNDWEALSGLGNVLGAKGRTDEAIATQRSALEKNPGYAAGHYNLGVLLFGLQRIDDAEHEFRETLRLAPRLAHARWYVAEILDGRGDRDGALAVLRDGLREQPGERMLEQKLESIQARPR